MVFQLSWEHELRLVPVLLRAFDQLDQSEFLKTIRFRHLGGCFRKDETLGIASYSLPGVLQQKGKVSSL